MLVILPVPFVAMALNYYSIFSILNICIGSTRLPANTYGLFGEIFVEQERILGTFTQVFANSVIRPASIKPKPKKLLTLKPRLLIKKLSVLITSDRDVSTIKYMTSRHVNDGFASSAKAIMPAAMGADADVPE